MTKNSNRIWCENPQEKAKAVAANIRSHLQNPNLAPNVAKLLNTMADRIYFDYAYPNNIEHRVWDYI